MGVGGKNEIKRILEKTAPLLKLESVARDVKRRYQATVEMG